MVTKLPCCQQSASRVWAWQWLAGVHYQGTETWWCWCLSRSPPARVQDPPSLAPACWKCLSAAGQPCGWCLPCLGSDISGNINAWLIDRSDNGKKIQQKMEKKKSDTTELCYNSTTLVKICKIIHTPMRSYNPFKMQQQNYIQCSDLVSSPQPCPSSNTKAPFTRVDHGCTTMNYW